MSVGAWVLLVALAGAVAVGTVRALRDGRFRGRPTPAAATVERPASVLAGTAYADDLGERATLLQFSSAFCAPCRATRLVLHQVAVDTPGVRHVEVDAEAHLDLVRRLGVHRTPTTLLLDGDGVERFRAQGVARRDAVVAALAVATGVRPSA